MDSQTGKRSDLAAAEAEIARLRTLLAQYERANELSRSIANTAKFREENYRRVFEGAQTVLYTFKPGQGGVYYSANVADLTGHSLEELSASPMHWHDAIHENDVMKVDALLANLREGQTGEIDYRFRHAGGHWLWFHDRYSVRADTDGSLVIDGIAADITARRQTEEELERANELLDSLREMQALYIADPSDDGVFESLLGVLVKVTQSQYGFIDEVCRDEDGDLFKRSLALSNISWDERSVALYEQLKQRGLKFENLDNLSGLPAVTGELVLSNDVPADPRSGGLPEGHPPIHNFLGMPLYIGGDLVGVAGVANRPGGYSEDIPAFLEPLLNTFAGVVRATKRERERQDYEARLRESEQALRESEERYRSFVESAPLSVLVVQDGHYVFANPAGSRLLGFESPQAIVGVPALDSIHPEDVEAVRQRMANINTGQANEWMSMRVAGQGGRVVEVESTSIPIHFEGRPAALVIGQEVGERRRMEKALLRNRKLLAEAERVAQVGAWELDVAKGEFAFSEEWMRIHGVSQPSLGWEDLLGLAYPADLPAIEAAFARALDHGEPYEIEHRIVRGEDGEMRRVSAHAAPVLDADGKTIHLHGAVQDVTEVREAEEERARLTERLQEAQRWESLSTLAGGVAHHFNNLLHVILGYASIAQEEMVPETPGYEFMHEIEVTAQRASNLAAQMLACSGRGAMSKKPLDVSALIREMEDLLRSLTRDDVSLVFELAERLPSVRADSRQMRQMVNNLVANAFEAFDGFDAETANSSVPRRVVIATGTRHCSAAFLEALAPGEGCQPGSYVYLRVSDNGQGMNEAVRSRLFDPFFSTKFTGRGLGLPAVRGIMRGHNGAVEVQTHPAKGASFTLYLPALAEASQAAPGPAAEPGGRGSGLILLVDDEPSVLSVGARMLEKAGYSVLTARNGEEAVRLFHKQPDAFRCVVLDVLMPIMDGEEAFGELRRIRSGIPVLIASGYEEDDLARRFDGRENVAFLQKPFRAARLNSQIAALLRTSE